MSSYHKTTHYYTFGPTVRHPGQVRLSEDRESQAVVAYSMGDQPLYGLTTAVTQGGVVSTSSTGTFGIRSISSRLVGKSKRGALDRRRHQRDRDGEPQGRDSGIPRAVSGRGLGGDRASELLGRPVTAGELFALAPDNAAAKELVTAALDEMSMHVANLAIAIDPQRIAVGGGLVRSAEVLLPALRDRLAHAVPFPPELVAARFDQNASLLGAIALALGD
jgi:hypothetical protein